ncbi:GNAT family N-acetyltransferase [Qipengyuania gaetbuli]|nr:GNAT family N-acetyltransferase [Qipengyuania gaetbuli]
MSRFEEASPKDAEDIRQLVESAYRGDSARQGWTHEADLLDGERTSMSEIERMIGAPDIALCVARNEEHRIVGCVAVTAVSDSLGYLGMLTVSPTLQSAGLGTKLLRGAEEKARSMGLKVMEMTVISQRDSLIAWYERSGYRPTGERRPFPILRDPPLEFVVLAKPLSAD